MINPDDWSKNEYGDYLYGEDLMGENFTTRFERKIGLLSDDEHFLIRMNDVERKTFSEIADWVEANL